MTIEEILLLTKLIRETHEQNKLILHKIEKLEKLIMATRADLDAALAASPAAIAQAVVAAIAANNPPPAAEDFSAEVLAVGQLPAQVAQIVAPAPAAPTPGPLAS